MKKVIVHLLVVMLPYISVMLAWLFSFGAFDYQLTVTQEGFYAFCTVYWIIIQWFAHFAVHEFIIDEF